MVARFSRSGLRIPCIPAWSPRSWSRRWDSDHCRAWIAVRAGTFEARFVQLDLGVNGNCRKPAGKKAAPAKKAAAPPNGAPGEEGLAKKAAAKKAPAKKAAGEEGRSGEEGGAGEESRTGEEGAAPAKKAALAKKGAPGRKPLQEGQRQPSPPPRKQPEKAGCEESRESTALKASAAAACSPAAQTTLNPARRHAVPHGQQALVASHVAAGLCPVSQDIRLFCRSDRKSVSGAVVVLRPKAGFYDLDGTQVVAQRRAAPATSRFSSPYSSAPVEASPQPVGSTTACAVVAGTWVMRPSPQTSLPGADRDDRPFTWREISAGSQPVRSQHLALVVVDGDPGCPTNLRSSAPSNIGSPARIETRRECRRQRNCAACWSMASRPSGR